MSRQRRKSFSPQDLVADIDLTAVTSDIDLTVPGSDAIAARSSEDLCQQQVQNVSWTTTVLEHARCSAAVIEGSSLERVVIRDCELSGFSLIDCSIRDCVIIGGRAAAMLSIVDCAINGLWIVNLSADRIEIQGGTIRSLSITDSKVSELVFNQPRAAKRATSTVQLQNLKLDSVGGISQLATAGVKIAVDPELWVLFGDLLLRQMGIEQLDPSGHLNNPGRTPSIGARSSPGQRRA